MDFGFTADQLAFRQEVSDLLSQEWNRDEAVAMGREELAAPMRRFLKKLGQLGWLSATWPTKYGGKGWTAIQLAILQEEMAYFGAHMGGFNAGGRIVAPTLLLYGTEEQKQEFLPKIAAAEIEFALGYTEPEAGSDLASLQMRATEVEGGFIISGQKMFNTACHRADYHWLAARTDPTAPKHRGVSLFMVDLKSPGITVKSFEVMDGILTNAVYYDDVFVPKKNLVGEKNKGFQYIATALSFERVFVVGDLFRVLENLVNYAKKTRDGERFLIDYEWVRWGLAEFTTTFKLCRLMCYRVVWMQSKGTMLSYEASQLKLFMTEAKARFANFAERLLGHLGEMRDGTSGSPMLEPMARFYLRAPVDTVVGGTSEIQRNIMATRGLGLPR